MDATSLISSLSMVHMGGTKQHLSVPRGLFVSKGNKQRQQRQQSGGAMVTDVMEGGAVTDEHIEDMLVKARSLP